MGCLEAFAFDGVLLRFLDVFFPFFLGLRVEQRWLETGAVVVGVAAVGIAAGAWVVVESSRAGSTVLLIYVCRFCGFFTRRFSLLFRTKT